MARRVPLPKPFYFAWVEKTETTYGPQHQVKDLVPLAFRMDHEENQIPTLTIDLKNPRAGGWLATGKKVNAWLSYYDGVAFVPLFFGRLLGWPTDMSGEKITLQFTAKASDFQAQKAAVAEAMKVLPGYDNVFVDVAKRDDPDTVLEGYSAYWHFDRITRAVSTSDIIVGEDGLEVFAASEVPYSGVKTTLNQNPLKAVSVDASVRWAQASTGTIDMGTQNIESYTGDGLIADWPKPGTKLQNGWSVESASAIDVRGIGSLIIPTWSFKYQNNAKSHENGDTLSLDIAVTGYVTAGILPRGYIMTQRIQVGLNDPFSDPPINRPATAQTTTLDVMKWLVQTSLVLRYEAGKNRTERIKFTLEADLQPIQTDADEAEVTDTIAIDGNDVSIAIPDGNSDPSIPIGDPTRNSYFLQPRGISSLEHLICRARAKLLLKARALRIQATIPFARAAGLSCRKNAQIPDGRYPEGHAVGKIIAYSLSVDGETGEMIGNVTIACAIGFGNAVAAMPGTPEYVDEGVLDPGIQFYTNSTIVVAGTGAVGYSPPVDVPQDDGLRFPLTKAQVVVSESITGSAAAQLVAIEAAVEVEKKIAEIQATPSTSEQMSIAQQSALNEAAKNNLAAALKANPVSYRLELLPVDDAKYERLYEPQLTKLQVPMQVNLREPPP